MATRQKRTWKLDSQGQYARQIGWKRSSKGRRVQHKFRLGSDLQEARRREHRLRELWEQVEAEASSAEPLWDDVSLEIARQIAKGARQIVVSPHDGESDSCYARRYDLVAARFTSIRFEPADMAKYAAGSNRPAYSLSDVLVWPESPRSEYERSSMGARDPVVAVGARVDKRVGRIGEHFPGPSSPGLHQGMQDYIAWIEEHYYREGLERITDSAHTKIKQVQTLMERHDDVPLSQIGFETIEDMIRYWRRRPAKKGTKKSISRKSAENYIGELKRFFKWLHRSSKYVWRKPEDFDGIDTTVDSDPADTRRRLAQASVFTLEELTLLNRYATPLDRVFLLLGLNCGFNVAEIASLTVEEVCLFQAHSPRDQELLHYETTDQDSFIKRVRHKSGVYGEFLLFEQTVQAMQWALQRRRNQPNCRPDVSLLVNGAGERFDTPTRNGNRNQQIPNRFARLLKRIREEGHDMSNLSFGKLRKTAADLIRRFSNGEVSGVFLCHGQPVRTDDLADVYTNRPFGKVFASIRRVEEYLKPVFEAAGDNPFPPPAEDC